MTDVFISYARPQAAKARQIAAWLQSEGYSVWWDVDLPAHRVFSEVIEERLTAAKAVLVLWSAASVRSEWVRAEADLARAHHKLVQASIDGVLPPMPFNQTQTADLQEWAGDATHPQWRKVEASLAELTGRTAPPPAAPARGGRLRGLVAAVRSRPRLTAGLAGGLLAVGALAVGLAAWSGGDSPKNLGSGRIEVTRFQPGPADPELERTSKALNDATVRELTSAGLEASAADGAVSARTAEMRVTGDVEREGGVVVINSQILDPRSGQVLWSGRFEGVRGKEGVMVAVAGRAIAGYLHCVLTDRAAGGQQFTSAAMSLYLSACEGVIGDFGPERMLTVTRRLTDAAPNLGAAWAMHSIASARVAESLRSGPEVTHLADEARQAADRALRISPRAAKAYLGRAIVDGLDGHWIAQEQDLQAALRIDPNLSPARMVYALLLKRVGRFAESLEMGSRVVDSADPRGADFLSFAVVMAAATGDHQRALDLLSRPSTAELETLPSARWMMAVWWDDPRETLANLRSLSAGGEPRDVACVEAHLKIMIAARFPARGLPPQCKALPPDWRIRMLARQGDIDGAYAEYAALRTPPLSVLFFYPEMRAFRRDPRFPRLAAGLGLAAYWRDSGHLPDFCQETDLPFDCRQAFH